MAANQKPSGDNLLGQNIEQARDQMSLSPKQLADHMGVSDKQISHWENGRRSPNVVQLIRLCQKFKCTPNDLLGWTDGE